MLSPYLGLLKYTKVENMTPKIIVFMLKQVNVVLPEDVAGAAFESAKNLMSDKGYTNLGQLAVDPDFITLISQFSSLMKPEVDDEKDDNVDMSSLVSKESMIKCPHCQNPFAIINALH